MRAAEFGDAATTAPRRRRANYVGLVNYSANLSSSPLDGAQPYDDAEGMRILPSPAEVVAATPEDRDRSLDLVRLMSLLVVITGHGVMLMVTVTPGHLAFGNLLAGSVGLQALTWLLQVLPLFFFAGAASSAMGWRKGAGWGRWLIRRAQRLYRPVFFYIAAWAVVLFGLRGVVAPAVYERIAAISTQLLWFIGMYIVVLAFVPALAAISRRRQLITVVGGLLALAATVDAIRLGGGPASVGYLNMFVWLIPAALGIGYVRGLVTRRLAAFVAIAFLAIDIALVTFGPYDLSLVTVDGQRLSNMTPPSLLLAGHAIVLSCLFIAVAPWCSALTRNARVWWFVAIGNRGAMTLYLWHMPALLAITAISHLLGHDKSSADQPGFVLLLGVQLVALYLLTSVLFLALSPLENRPLPWWDSTPAEIRGVRGAVVGMSVVCAGIGILVAAKWGLNGSGIWCTAAALGALLLARTVAEARVSQFVRESSPAAYKLTNSRSHSPDAATLVLCPDTRRRHRSESWA